MSEIVLKFGLGENIYLIMDQVAGESKQHGHYYENEKFIAPDGTEIYSLGKGLASPFYIFML